MARRWRRSRAASIGPGRSSSRCASWAWPRIAVNCVRKLWRDWSVGLASDGVGSGIELLVPSGSVSRIVGPLPTPNAIPMPQPRQPNRRFRREPIAAPEPALRPRVRGDHGQVGKPTVIELPRLAPELTSPTETTPPLASAVASRRGLDREAVEPTRVEDAEGERRDEARRSHDAAGGAADGSRSFMSHDSSSFHDGAPIAQQLFRLLKQQLFRLLLRLLQQLPRLLLKQPVAVNATLPLPPLASPIAVPPFVASPRSVALDTEPPPTD